MKRQKNAIPVVTNDNKFYFSLKEAARLNGTFTAAISLVLQGRQRMANGKTFRKATMEEVKVARRLAKNEGWDRVLPKCSEAPVRSVELRAAEKDAHRSVIDSIDDIKANLNQINLGMVAIGKKMPDYQPKSTVTNQILETTPAVGPGVSVADAQLLRLQLGRFDVLWRQYRGRIFATTATVAEEDVQLGKLLEAALANLQRSYDRERSKRQGG